MILPSDATLSRIPHDAMSEVPHVPVSVGQGRLPSDPGLFHVPRVPWVSVSHATVSKGQGRISLLTDSTVASAS